jgi:RND family efflux transporter MFP subunit
MNKIILVIAIITGLIFSSCKKEQQARAPSVPVNLYTVKSQRVVYYDRYTATAAALSQVNLHPQVQGYITGIFFKEGSYVKKDQKLYEIDKSIFENNYNTAAANLRVAEGNLKQAQQDADRYEYLNKNRAVAKQIYDHAMVALENSKNAYKSAEESLKTASTNLGYSTIKAPFDGEIGFSQVKLGDLAVTGQTTLNTISTVDPMGVDFLINEKQLSFFEKIQGNSNPVDSLFTLILPDNSVFPYTGKISVIDRAVDPQTGSLRIRLEFPNPKQNLRTGMSLVLQVRNQDSTPQLVIPNSAVVEEMGEYFVYEAKDTVMNNPGEKEGSPAQQKNGSSTFAFQRKVKIGAIIGPNIIVKDGIREGTKIVVDGVQSLHNGSAIAPKDRRNNTPARNS